MLTGQLPFKGEYESAVIYSILNDTQEPATGLRTGMPMELEQIINKCLNKNPSDRYQHVDDLMVDLKGLKSESTDIRSKEEKQKKHSKTVLIPITILSILILIVGGYFFNPFTDSEQATTDKTGWENSIAVLPFADLSPEKNQEYFCDGMTEQIITNLSKIKRLKVIARTSVMTYKNTDKQIPQIGKELDVSHILEGSIRKYGSSIRVTAQLINTEDGSHLWADDFDRELEHVFEVQDDVSQAIASNLLATLSPQEKKEIKTDRPNNTKAYELYMKGRYYHYNKYWGATVNLEDFKKSERMLLEAINLDPDYAPSYASLACLYNTYFNFSANTEAEREKYLKLQEDYIYKAIEIEPQHAEVQRVKGLVHCAKNEVNEEYKSYIKSIQINPTYEKPINNLGMFLADRGLIDLAIEFLTKGIELDPLQPMSYKFRGEYFATKGKWNRAEEDFQKALELNPNHRSTLFEYGHLLIILRKYNKAEKILRNIKIIYPDSNTDWYYALIYASKGQKEKALNTYKDKSTIIYSLLEMKDEALGVLTLWCERQLKQKISQYYFLKNNPFYENLRSDPRFQEILAKHKELYEENLRKYGDIDI
jgi:TolB-like protein/Tfp pilus assembly protein PilF